MKKLILSLTLAFCISTIYTNTTMAIGNILLPDDKIGILSAKIEAPKRQDIEENITIITSIEVASKC